MKNIKIADVTLCKDGYTFKEKLEIARLLDALCVDIIALPPIGADKADEVLVRTMASFVKQSTLSVAVFDDNSLSMAVRILAGIPNASIRVEVPVSTVGMEYTLRKKAPQLTAWVQAAVTKAAQAGFAVAFCAEDATRAEPEFLSALCQAAVQAGASGVTVCDDEGLVMPDAFAMLVARISAAVSVPVGVRCTNGKGIAVAQSLLAVKAGAQQAAACVNGEYTPLETLVQLLHDGSAMYGVRVGVNTTQLHRTVGQIAHLNLSSSAEQVQSDEAFVALVASDDSDTVLAAAVKLGYDLSEQDQVAVYEEFLRVAKKKAVGAKELDAIVGSVAMQYPAVYKVDSYVINNGNVITASAQITLKKGEELLHGISNGDGPIDAAFRALEQIVGQHYELDDFQIRALTEGREAVGQAQVKLRWGGKVYVGNGISTDIIGASIRAYVGAVNKIVYEEK